jgi:uncharacterized protein (TIGR02270 family)
MFIARWLHWRSNRSIAHGLTHMASTGVTILSVVRQHAEEAASLQLTREALVRFPHVDLEALHRFDDRIAAHLDGLSVAADDAWLVCEAPLEDPSAGAVFTAAIVAITSGRTHHLDRLWTLAASSLQIREGLIAAFEWLDPAQLHGIVAGLLESPDAARREIGVAACAAHSVDPGLISTRMIRDPDARVRARGLRAAGELGSLDTLPLCMAALDDENAACRFWGASSAVMLGNRGKALEALSGVAASADNKVAGKAFELVLLASNVGRGHAMLQLRARDSARIRDVVHGCGLVGDPAYAPWLVSQMSTEPLARLAGEAFTCITGADLSSLNLERPGPDTAESGPTDNPDDADVQMDPDDGLPWPDPLRVEQWWARNGGHFQAGRRYFRGEPLTRAECIEVLKNGCQRQRTIAAYHRCLLESGLPLFNTRAPAWRQKKLLSQMS